MDIGVFVFSLLETIIFILIIFIALIYAIPIICIRRFHQHNNILTINVCLATILSCICWLPTSALFMLDNSYEQLKKFALLIYILDMIFTIQVPFSFVVASLHRYYTIVYHTKSFFKSKQWIILCIGSQWILGFILTIPALIRIYQFGSMFPGLNIYTFVSIVMIPSIMCFVINMLIYKHVRSSSRRIQPSAISGNIQSLMTTGDIKPAKFGRRDIVLLRHMVLMFCIFVGGWAPIYIIAIINDYMPVHRIVHSSFTVWCELALVCDMIDLFLYNHELRKYLKDVCLRIFHR